MSRHPFPTRAMVARIVEINEKLGRQEIEREHGLAYDRLKEEQARKTIKVAMMAEKDTGE